MTKHYPDLSANPEFPKIEQEILKFWQDQKVFEASVENRPAKKDGKSNEFIFYDGPPFANGLPHYGHLLTGFVKDLFARYQTQKGKRVERRFGWDCHGLPAEMGAEKELGISGTQAIKEYGIAKFNEYCRTSVMKYTGEWEQYVTRQARWVDFKNDYKTMDFTFMESTLWVFKQLFDKGLLYEAYRVMPYSWAAETPLSNFETRLDNSYREREDKAITVAFELVGVPEFIQREHPDVTSVKVLAWTTTPWTLPSNLALAVGEKVAYNLIQKGNEAYIIASYANVQYAQQLMSKNAEGVEEFKNLTSMTADQLVGLRYRPLFPYFANRAHTNATIDGAIIETDRLYLRAFTETDYPLYQSLQSDPKVAATTSDGLLPEEKIRAEFDRFLADQSAKGFTQWAVFRKQDHAFMGRAGFDNRDYDQFNTSGQPSTEIRYALLSDFWGQGYATETATALLEWGVRNLTSDLVTAGCNPTYTPAVKLLQKLGFASHHEVPFRNQQVLYHTLSLADWAAKTPAQSGAFRILSGDFIEEGSGTGVVHMAPGFGEDDQRVCEANGIAVLCPVDQAGRYTAEIYDISFEPPSSMKGRPESEKNPHLPLRERPESQEQPPLPMRERVGERGYGLSTLENAKSLRSTMTDVGSILWKELRAKRFESYKFRREQPIGEYIVDFACLAEKLIIELDGGQHSEQAAYDEKRTAFLSQQGYRVLRFWNNDLTSNLEGVLQEIARVLGENPSPQPSPSRGEGAHMLRLSGLNVIAEQRAPDDTDKALHIGEKDVQKFGLANMRILRWLKANNALIKDEVITHNYPHCWRTDKPLIYKALPSWYVEVTKFKDRMVELNQQINWIPGHVKDGLFGKWLENARDWSISRNRFWGAPVPVWKSDKPGSTKLYVFGSAKELSDFFGQPVTDLHRPFIDDLTKPDPEDANYTLRRVTDVLDCWFESGSMPYGQIHYPHEKKDWFASHFPADFIVEYAAQTRGWFYTLMVLGTALFDKPPFLNCICHGVVLDANGQKLSKRLNNYPDPNLLFEQYGADALRWFMMASPVMRGNELYIDKEGLFIRDAVRLYIKPLWNAYNFFTLYANADGTKASLLKGKTQTVHVMDTYILAKLKAVVQAVETALDAYDTPTACASITDFLDMLNNWYIRRSKERFWKPEKDADKQDAYDTLYTVLHILARTVAPLLPLLSEEIYSGLVNNGRKEEKHSVHLADWPNVSAFADAADTIVAMDLVSEVCNAALALRNKENIRVRQPLQTMKVVSAKAGALVNHPAMWNLLEIIQDEINLKAPPEFSSNPEDIKQYADYKLQIHFPTLGKKYGKLVPDIKAAATTGVWEIQKNGEVALFKTKGEAPFVTLLPDEAKLLLEPKADMAAHLKIQPLSSNDAIVVLDTTITEPLRQEGLARDLIRMIQEARKNAGFNVSDRITLSLALPGALQPAIKAFEATIAEQVLAVAVQYGASESGHNATQELDGQPITIGLNLAKQAAA